MQVNKIAAESRSESGKGIARRLRASGRIPAVAYGKGVGPLALIVDPGEVKTILTSSLGVNSVLELDIDGGKKVQAMIADYQYHPVSRALLHADFIAIDESAEVEVRIPLILFGKSKGIVLGGKLRQVFREVPVRCVPSKIPAELRFDITELDIDDAVPAGDLVLPEGVSLAVDAKRTVAMIATDRRAKMAEDEEGAEGEAKPEAEA
jgi:large subunit ribosomal protein L25